MQPNSDSEQPPSKNKFNNRYHDNYIDDFDLHEEIGKPIANSFNDCDLPPIIQSSF